MDHEVATYDLHVLDNYEDSIGKKALWLAVSPGLARLPTSSMSPAFETAGSSSVSSEISTSSSAAAFCSIQHIRPQLHTGILKSVFPLTCFKPGPRAPSIHPIPAEHKYGRQLRATFGVNGIHGMLQRWLPRRHVVIKACMTTTPVSLAPSLRGRECTLGGGASRKAARTASESRLRKSVLISGGQESGMRVARLPLSLSHRRWPPRHSRSISARVSCQGKRFLCYRASSSETRGSVLQGLVIRTRHPQDWPARQWSQEWVMH